VPCCIAGLCQKALQKTAPLCQDAKKTLASCQVYHDWPARTVMLAAGYSMYQICFMLLLKRIRFLAYAFK